MSEAFTSFHASNSPIGHDMHSTVSSNRVIGRVLICHVLTRGCSACSALHYQTTSPISYIVHVLQPLPTMFDTPSPFVTLISNDGFEFIVSRDAACVAGTIKKMLDPTSKPIPPHSFRVNIHTATQLYPASYLPQAQANSLKP